MGNQQSQDTVPSSSTISHLSHRTRTKLSEQKPGIKHLLLPPIHHVSNKKSATDDYYNNTCLTPTTLSSRSSSFSTSSYSKYTASNGRKYMTSSHSRCLLPCDEEESDRLIIQHFLLKDAFGANFISPVHSLLQAPMNERPQVLEIGTGPGTWVLEMATEFSETEFYGIDISAMYPTTIKPSNAHFRQHDILEGAIPFEDASFDFIYMRQTLSTLTQSQLAHIFSEMTRVLKPNGYLEIVDVEYQIQRVDPCGMSSLVNHYLQKNVSSTQGLDFDLCAQLATLTHHGGLTDMMQEKVAMPLGWGDQLGDLHGRNLELFLKSLHPATSPSSPQQQQYPRMDDNSGGGSGGFVLTDQVIRDTLEECKYNKSHLTWHTFTARKPVSWQNEKEMTVACHYTNSLLSSPPTPPLDPVEWESINSFVTGYVE